MVVAQVRDDDGLHCEHGHVHGKEPDKVLQGAMSDEKIDDNDKRLTRPRKYQRSHRTWR